MSRCVPNWDVDDTLLHHPHIPLPSSPSTTMSADNDVAELTWKDGHLATLSLRHPRTGKPTPRRSAPANATASGDGGTLQCIVDQARGAPSNPGFPSWVGGTHHAVADATVPCPIVAGLRKRVRVAGKKSSSQGSATPVAAAASGSGGGTKEDGGSAMPSPSLRSSENRDNGGCGEGGLPEERNRNVVEGRLIGVEEHVIVSNRLRSQHERLGERERASNSTKRSRVAAVHNQSERKRRDKINQKMKTLQKLLPNSNKADKASMLDEVIEYLKLLQAQVQMMSRMSAIPTMMLPVAMQHQQLQLSMLAQMAQMTRMPQMGFGLGMGMIDPSLLGRSVCPGLAPPSPILHPSAFVTPPSTGAWDALTTEWMQMLGGRVPPDMFSAFAGCPAQQQTMSSEAYSRMAALYQQLYQQPQGSNQKT